MTPSELTTRFAAARLSNRDFIRWAAERGVKVNGATISKQKAGLIAISTGWQLAYACFFEEKLKEK